MINIHNLVGTKNFAAYTPTLYNGSIAVTYQFEIFQKNT